jgi:hypothetical protein
MENGFPFSAAMCAPVWVAERAFSVWIALGARLVLGGIPYGSRAEGGGKS